VCIYSSINVFPNPEPSNCLSLLGSTLCHPVCMFRVQVYTCSRKVEPRIYTWNGIKWNPLKYRGKWPPLGSTFRRDVYTADLLVSRNLEYLSWVPRSDSTVASMYPRIQNPATVYLYWVPFCAILCACSVFRCIHAAGKWNPQYTPGMA